MQHNYQDLDVYQRSYRMGLEVHKITLSFPNFEKFELGRQKPKIYIDLQKYNKDL